MKLFIFLLALAFFACGQNQTSAQNEPNIDQQLDADSLVINNDQDHLLPRTQIVAQFVISREMVDNKLVTQWRIPRQCDHDKKHDPFDALIRHTYYLENAQWKRESEEIGYVDDSLVKYVY